MKTKTLSILILIVAIALVGLILYYSFIQEPFDIPDTKEGLKKFSSQSELEDFVKNNIETYPYLGGAVLEARDISAVSSVGAAKAEDYSQTNIQVEGVDEADIVKNDGKYIYAVSGNKLFIINAYPAENMEILSELEFDSISELFINEDKLIVFGYEHEVYAENGEVAKIIPPYYRSSKSFIKVYDVSDKSDIKIDKEIYADGNYYDSRMIGDNVYVILNSYVRFYDDVIPLPVIIEDGISKEFKAEEIYHFGYSDNSYQFTTILSLDIDSLDMQEEVYLTGYTQNLFVSLNNIYLTSPKTINYEVYFEQMIEEVYYPILPSNIDSDIKEMMEDDDLKYYEKTREINEIVYDYIESLGTEAGAELMKEMQEKMQEFQEKIWKEMQKTVIHRISIDNGNIKYKATGEVPGNVLNQFSMDEFDGRFRIATTLGNAWMSVNTDNNMYVLNMDLKIIGKLEGLAEGERIYSVRFIQNRAYMVTFRQVDPLFVIDLSGNKPEVLGKLKIPGYSSYLHPYDENHIIGIGQDATEEGRVLGVKIALFDVSDVSDPKEIDNYIFPRGSYSEVLYEHKAFLFSKDKNLLVLPVQIYQWNWISEENKSESFYGAYVFDISLEGIEVKGKISHVNDSEDREGYYWGPNVRRSLYMDNILYTISNSLLKANDLNDLEEINSIILQEYDEPIYRTMAVGGFIGAVETAAVFTPR